jgi:uncharacterized protein (DUF488 family)
MNPSKPTHLYTIGYQGKSIEEVIEVLERAKVHIVIDVRAMPISRRPSFSKTALSQVLQNKGIKYLNIPELGAGKELRETHRNGEFKAFARDYRRAVLVNRRRRVARLAEKVAARRVCLLCYEANPEECHRSLLANAVVRRIGREANVIHL